MSASQTIHAVSLPDPLAQKRFEALCGLDDVKLELGDALRIALAPGDFNTWAASQKGAHIVTDMVISRPQLFILGGDVGAGKTELAQTIGDHVARATKTSVMLFSLSLAARGTGFVGEMTQRIVAAFDEVRQWGEKRKGKAIASAGGILFIDEADAIAQSRSLSQMHHEDRAGVNALIRGIDDLTASGIPVAVLMATNRIDSIDPAIRRRAALEFTLGRPDRTQRAALYQRLFPEWEGGVITGLALVSEEMDPSFTYSDIVQRIVPRAVLAAFRSKVNLRPEHVLTAAEKTVPTPRFGEDK